jgi:cytochrome c-type biogenesis protein CcmH/NrfG
VDLAVVLMSQGRWEEADRELAEAKRMAPDLPAIWFLEGWIARDGLADTLRARRVWERFLELAPADAPQAAEIRRWLSDDLRETSGG